MDCNNIDHLNYVFYSFLVVFVLIIQLSKIYCVVFAGLFVDSTNPLQQVVTVQCCSVCLSWVLRSKDQATNREKEKKEKCVTKEKGRKITYTWKTFESSPVQSSPGNA